MINPFYSESGGEPVYGDSLGKVLDPRTGVDYGRYTEEEIVDEQLGKASVGVQFDLPAEQVHKDYPVTKELLKEDPIAQEKYTGIFQIMKHKFDIQKLQAETSLLTDKYMDSNDAGIMLEIQKNKADIIKLSEELPSQAYLKENFGLVHEIVRETAGQMGMMTNMVSTEAKNVARTAAQGGVVGGLASAAAIAAGSASAPLTLAAVLGGTAIGAKVGAAAHGLDYSRKLGRAEIYDGVIYAPYMDESERPPSDIAKAVADKWSPIYGASELAGMATMLTKGLGVGKKVVDRLLGIATEGGTEGFQQAIQQVAKWEADKMWAEQRGVEFNHSVTDYLDAAEIGEAVRLGALVAVGFSAPGTAYDTGKFSAEAVSTIQQREHDIAVRKLAEKQIATEKATNKAISEVADKPVYGPMTQEATEAGEIFEGSPLLYVDEDGVTTPVVKGAAIIPEEVERAGLDNRVEGTTITDGKLDDIIIDDEELSDDAISESVDETDASVTERVQDMYIALREFLPEEQARAVEGLTTARAMALGMSQDEYLEHHQLRWEVSDEEVRGTAATVEFIQDGETIIRAFAAADISSAIHELGHVFSRDLAGADKVAVDEFLGVDPGAAWDVQAEEKFARAFEAYIAEGKAPSKELESAFQSFARWMMNIYKSLRGSDIDIELTPEIRRVFDSMLVKADMAKKGLDKSVVGTESQTFAQTKSRIEDSYQADRERMVAERKAIRENANLLAQKMAGKDLTGLTPQDILKAQLRVQRTIARGLFDAGDHHGYTQAKNTMKAMLNRERGRYKTQRVHARAIDTIFKTLKAVKAKPVRGVMTSKQSARVNDHLQLLNKVMQGASTMKGIREMYTQHIENMDFGRELSPEERFRNQFLEAARIRSKDNIALLVEMNKVIKEVAAMGRSESPLSQNMAEAEAIVEQSMPDVTTSVVENGVTRTPEQQFFDEKKNKDIWKRIRTSSIGKDAIFGYNNFLNLVTSYSNKPFGESIIAKSLDLFQARQDKLTQLRGLQTRLMDAYLEAYGVTAGRLNFNYNKMVNEDAKPQYDIDGTGRMWSRSQLRQLWMYMQDKRLNVRLLNMGITPEVRDVVNDTLTDGDRAFAASMVSIFQDKTEYDMSNEAYRMHFGTSMPYIKDYIPQRSQSLSDLTDQVITQFQHDQYSRRGVTSAAGLKKRSYNADKAPLHIEGDILLYNTYQNEMTHFRTHAKVGRLANSVLKNKEFKAGVQREYGPRVYDGLIKSFTDIMADGAAAKNNYPIVDRFISEFVSSTLGLSFSVMMKQLISVVNYWQNMSTYDYVAGMGKFMLNPHKNLASMWNSEYLKNRRTSLDQDLKSLTATGEYREYALNPSIKNFLTLNVVIGDSLAIAIGGWVYKESLKKQINPVTNLPYTDKEAMNLVAKKSEQTQQSGAMAERSRIQRGGSITRSLIMYSSGPVQAIRQEIEAVRGVIGGENSRISKAQFAKTIFIYHVLVPAMYTAAASWLNDDDQEAFMKSLGISMVMGPMSSAYNVGRSAMNVARGIVGLKPYRDSGPFQDSVSNVTKIAKKFMDNDLSDLTLKDFAEATRSVSVLLAASKGIGGGLPVTQVTNRIENVAQGDVKGTIFGTNPNK